MAGAVRFYRVCWTHSDPGEPLELLYEVQSDNAVTRLVELFADGRAIADSLSLAADREPGLNIACLCDGGFPAPENIADVFAPPDLSCEAISREAFDAQFAQASPKTRE